MSRRWAIGAEQVLDLLSARHASQSETREYMGQQPDEADHQGSRVKQPNSRHCFGCGVDNAYGLAMTFYEEEPGHVTCDFTVPKHFEGYPGVVHGGVVATMLDEIAGRVVLIDDHARMMMTAKLVTRYRKPVPVGKPLKIEGWLRTLLRLSGDMGKTTLKHI